MAVIKRAPSIAAAADVDDQLTVDGVNLQHRVAQVDGVAELYATQSAAGLTLLFGTGNQVLARGLVPVVRATSPLVPDDIVAQVPILAGEAVSLGVRNPTGAPITLFYMITVP